MTLRYWAAAAHAAGVDSEPVEVRGSTTLADLVETAKARHDDRKFRDVLGCCSVLVGDRPANGEPSEVTVSAGQTVEFLPPFAGG